MKIEVPGVGVVEFPDGTPPDVIERALAQYASPQAQPAAPDGPPLITPEAAQGAIDNANRKGEMMGSFLNKAGEAMTFGLVGDEASAAVESLLPGVTYDERLKHYRDAESKLEQDAPAMALAAELGGAMAAPLGALGAVGRGASLARKVGTSAGVSGLLGGLYGFMEGEGGAAERANKAAREGAMSAGIGALVPGVGAMVGKAANRQAARSGFKRAAAGAPTTAQREAAAREAYRRVDDLGVEVSADAFNDAQQRILQALDEGTGFDNLPGPGSLTPRSARVMQLMQNASDEMAGNPNPALPFKSLDKMRRHAGAAAGNVTEKADQQAGMTIIDGLDDFIDNLSDSDVVAGDAKELPRLIKEARNLWHLRSKSQKLDDAMEAAENYRWGFSNGIKWQFKNILNNPKRARQFSEADKKVMQRVINGTIPEKVLEHLGSGLTTIGGLAGAGLGATTGGLPGILSGLALSGVSMGARGASNKIARKNAELARAIIAGGKSNMIPLEASPAIRQITEQLLRQGAAVSPKPQ